jgi:hypothetical protein
MERGGRERVKRLPVSTWGWLATCSPHSAGRGQRQEWAQPNRIDLAGAGPGSEQGEMELHRSRVVRVGE